MHFDKALLTGVKLLLIAKPLPVKITPLLFQNKAAHADIPTDTPHPLSLGALSLLGSAVVE